MLSVKAMQTLNCVFIVFHIPHMFYFCFASSILFSHFLMQCPLTKMRVPDQCHGSHGGKEKVASFSWSSAPHVSLSLPRPFLADCIHSLFTPTKKRK